MFLHAKVRSRNKKSYSQHKRTLFSNMLRMKRKLLLLASGTMRLSRVSVDATLDWIPSRCLSTISKSLSKGVSVGFSSKKRNLDVEKSPNQSLNQFPFGVTKSQKSRMRPMMEITMFSLVMLLATTCPQFSCCHPMPERKMGLALYEEEESRVDRCRERPCTIFLQEFEQR